MSFISNVILSMKFVYNLNRSLNKKILRPTSLTADKLVTKPSRNCFNQKNEVKKRADVLKRVRFIGLLKNRDLELFPSAICRP